ncbi:MAG: glucosaminidase domain-containing protein [Bacillota bacterium]
MLSKLAGVFVFAFVTITTMVPAVQAGEIRQNQSLVNETETVKNLTPKKKMFAQAKMKILTTTAVVKKKVVVKKKPVVKKKVVVKKKAVVKKKPVVKKKVVKKKTSRGDSDRVFMEPFGTSSFTSADYETMLAGSGLDGFGYAFKKMELKYGVNGLFAIGVAMLESGNGKSPLSGHNYFGMIGMKFDSTEDNIMYFGKLMSGRLYKGSGLTTIAGIGGRYCVGGTWAAKVIVHMKQRANKV